MKVDYALGEIRLDQPDSVDDFTYFSILDRIDDERRHERQRVQRIASQVDSLLADLNRAVIARVGQDGWDALRKYISERRRTNHGTNQHNFDRDSDSEAVAKLLLGRRESIDTALSILRDSNVSKADLVHLRRRYADQIAKLVQPGPSPQNLEIVEEKDVPERVRRATEHNQPITKMPPFQGGWHGGTILHWGGSAPTLVSHLSASVGRIGHTSTCVNLDADDSDKFLVEWTCTLGYWENIPTAGKWDVWIKARCTKASSSYTYYNEWGESWVSSSMYAGITFGADTWEGINLANHYPYGAGDFWNSYANGDWDGTTAFNNTWRTPGKAFWFHTWRNKVKAKNNTFIFVGSHDDVNSTINDMGVSLVMQNNWTIEQVSIEITP